MERADKLAANENFSATLTTKEEQEESFILDPSQLTAQDMQLTVSVPSVSLQAFAVYVVPSEVRGADGNEDLPFATNVPLLRVAVRGVTGKATASNNPWVVRGSAAVESLRVQLLQKEAAVNADTELPEPLLSLPKVTGSFTLTQTSSMSRFIGE